MHIQHTANLPTNWLLSLVPTMLLCRIHGRGTISKQDWEVKHQTDSERFNVGVSTNCDTRTEKQRLSHVRFLYTFVYTRNHRLESTEAER